MVLSDLRRLLRRPPSDEERRAAAGTPPIPLVSTEYKLALLFSAKSGCTFAVRWFFFQVGHLQRALQYNSWIHRYRTEVYYKEQDIERLFDPKTRIVKFVRNPYERAVSSYAHAVGSDYLDTEIASFLGRGVSPGNRFSFREFILYLESIALDQNCNIHHRLQCHRTELMGSVRPHDVIRIEDSVTLLPQVEKKLDLKQSFPKDLRDLRHHTHRYEVKDLCADTEFVFESQRLKKIPKAAAFYDAQLVALVGRLYARDFEAYGYSRDWPGQRRSG